MNTPLYQRPELTPPPSLSPVCLGVCCEKHAKCQRYHDVEFSTSSVVRIGTCGEKRGLFVPIRGAA